jgi:hypothetical protein
MRFNFFLLMAIIFCLAGCGVKSQPFDVLLNKANSEIEIAQKAGADQLASTEFEESKSLLEGAKTAPKSKQKEILVKRSYAKARLSEAIAKQVKAENEAVQLETELKTIEEDANKIRLERQTVENELNELLNQNKNE